MTRINLLPPEKLCDEHLRAEYREITRIPNLIIRGKIGLENIPIKYSVRTKENPNGGQGHVKFFVDKLFFLKNRYDAIRKELGRRGFLDEDRWPKDKKLGNDYKHLWNGYCPSPEEINLNIKRILERSPKNPHFYGKKIKNISKLLH